MPHSDQQYLELALKQAEQSRLNGNHPFGAVLVDESGDVLLAAENSVITQSDVTAHAELNLVRAATRTFDTEKLASCSIYSSAEPCPMCAGAILQSRIQRVVYGTTDPKAGAVHSLYHLLDDDRLNHRAEVTQGVLAEPCGRILTDFFRDQRKLGKK